MNTGGSFVDGGGGGGVNGGPTVFGATEVLLWGSVVSLA